MMEEIKVEDQIKIPYEQWIKMKGQACYLNIDKVNIALQLGIIDLETAVKIYNKYNEGIQD
jgi:hypothetical protein